MGTPIWVRRPIDLVKGKRPLQVEAFRKDASVSLRQASLLETPKKMRDSYEIDS